MCTKCRGFYASHLLWKHLLKCTGDEADCDTTGSDLRAASYVATINPKFNKIPSCFHDDNISTICKTDPMITVVGKALWERSVHKDKKTVMGEMRKLGNLFPSMGSGGEMNLTFKSLQLGALLRAEDSYWGSGQSARVGAKYSENRRYGEVCWFHHWLTAGPINKQFTDASWKNNHTICANGKQQLFTSCTSK